MRHVVLLPTRKLSVFRCNNLIVLLAGASVVFEQDIPLNSSDLPRPSVDSGGSRQVRVTTFAANLTELGAG